MTSITLEKLQYFANELAAKITEKFVKKESGKGLSSNDYTTEEKTKLAGLKNLTVDSALSSSSTNPVQNKVVNSALGGKVPTTRKVNNKPLSADITLTADDVGAVPTSKKGAAGGVAELDSSGKVPAAQLPSYVDDVIEGYLSGGKFYKESAHTTEITGESGKIYIDITSGKTYRWSGSAFAVISETLALGTTSATAGRGDWNKTAYDHSQKTHAPATALKGATSSAAGAAGYVPAPAAGDQNKFLKADGTWGTPTNTTYSAATSSKAGLMSAADKTKLDGITEATDTDIDNIIAGLFTE